MPTVVWEYPMRLRGRHLTKSQRRDRTASPFKLGVRRPARHLDHDVNIRAIPYLTGPYVVHGAAEIAIAGDAPKNFVRRPSGLGYIAKEPRTQREGYRECVTEYLIWRLGTQLPVELARGGLVRLRAPPGAKPDVRFLSLHFLRHDEALVHGVEIVARCFDMLPDRVSIEVSRDQERGFYTVDLIVEVIEHAFPGQSPQLVEALGKMIGFDALVGANDRHPMNWGVIENVVAPGPVRFAPLFDTARGLFWNYSDEQLRAQAGTRGARRQLIANYAEKSTPLIGMQGGSQAGSGHFELVRYLAGAPKSPLLKPIRQIILAFRPEAAAAMLHRNFGALLSRLRLELIDELLRHRQARLKDILGLR